MFAARCRIKYGMKINAFCLSSCVGKNGTLCRVWGIDGSWVEMKKDPKKNSAPNKNTVGRGAWSAIYPAANKPSPAPRDPIEENFPKRTRFPKTYATNVEGYIPIAKPARENRPRSDVKLSLRYNIPTVMAENSSPRGKYRFEPSMSVRRLKMNVEIKTVRFETAPITPIWVLVDPKFLAKLGRKSRVAATAKLAQSWTE